MTPDPMPLHHQLFLTAHDPDGEPRAHPIALRLCLSAALITELVLAENLQVRGDRFWPVTITGHRHPDPLAAATIIEMNTVAGPKHLSHWLRVMSATITDRISGGLLAAGHITRQTRRRDTRYPHVNTHIGATHIAAVRQAVSSHHVAHPHVLALAGFFATLRLEGLFGFNLPTSDILDRLKTLNSHSSAPVQEVLALAERLIGDAAMSAYR